MRAAASLRRASRVSDVVARFGEDEFGVLAIECDRDCSRTLLHCTLALLSEDNINASAGLAM